MFLQKLILEEGKSYSTTTTLENLIENIHLSFNHVVILTPYLSKSDGAEKLKNNILQVKSVSTLTPTIFSKNKDCFNCSHVIVEDSSLFAKFGYDIDQFSYIEINENSKLPRINLCKFHINCREEEPFVIIYILSKLYSHGTVVCKNSKKLKIFFKVFELQFNLISYEDLSSLEGNELGECVIFIDGYVHCDAERVFCLGNKPCKLEVLKIDLNLAGKFKYRINDLYRAITPAVVKGHKEFDYEKFSKINK